VRRLAARAGVLALIAACQAGADRRPPTRIEPAGDGEVAALVAAADGRARAAGRRLVVYVGAAWCEPCVAFHRAAAAGELDRALAGVDFLEFDFDRDEARLTRAGYTSTWLPLFALPNRDGTASDRRIEGARRGADYARTLAARMEPLLAP
jgi:hypothetical protein